MKAEERARRAFKYIYGRIVEDIDKDVITAWTAAIREAEQQARKEALELAAVICDSKAGQRNNEGAMAQECSGDIRALIEREGGE